MAKKTSTPASNGSVRIQMDKEKDCKGSVKYSTPDRDAVVTNVYVSRSFDKEMPESIVVTIEAE